MCKEQKDFKNLCALTICYIVPRKARPLIAQLPC